MSNSDHSPAAPQGGRDPPTEKPVWCPRADGSRQTGSPAGHCSHPLSLSSQTLLCHRVSYWMVKLVGWGLCTPFSLLASLAHGFFLFILCHVSNVEEEVIVIHNGWTPRKEGRSDSFGHQMLFWDSRRLASVSLILYSI